jgi:hypothetical protein
MLCKHEAPGSKPGFSTFCISAGGGIIWWLLVVAGLWWMVVAGYMVVHGGGTWWFVVVVCGSCWLVGWLVDAEYEFKAVCVGCNIKCDMSLVHYMMIPLHVRSCLRRVMKDRAQPRKRQALTGIEPVTFCLLSNCSTTKL